MAETNETIADIIAWLRIPRDGENAYLTLWRGEIADHLEAAHKREIDAHVRDADSRVSRLTSHVAKLRAALEVADVHATRIMAITTVPDLYRDSLEVVRHHAVEIGFNAAETVGEIDKEGDAK